MKNLLILLCCFPLFANAQKSEVGINLGVGPCIYDYYRSYAFGAEVHLAASYTYIFKTLQYGASVEAGSGSYGFDGYIAPGLFVNRIFSFKHFYLYAGGLFGMPIYQSNWLDLREKSVGLITDIQGGIVWKLSKHFAWNGQISFREAHSWDKEYDFYTETTRKGYQVSYYLPLSVGIKYRF